MIWVLILCVWAVGGVSLAMSVSHEGWDFDDWQTHACAAVWIVFPLIVAAVLVVLVALSIVACVAWILLQLSRLFK